MRYSISNTTQKRRETELLSGIQNYGSVGKPFMMQFDAPVQAWWLVPEGCENGIPLDVSFIESDGDKYYYNGSTDLIGYLQGLGYSVPYGKYRFKVNGGGNIDYYIESISGYSSAKILSDQAYGVWEFTAFIKDNLYQAVDCYMVENTPYIGDYTIAIDSVNDVVKIRRIDGGGTSIISSSASYYISQDQEYNIKVERNSIINEYHTGLVGSWAYYISGGSFGNDYILVDVTGGVGTNPVLENSTTQCENISFTIGDGCYVKNLILNGEKNDFNNVSLSENANFYTEITGGINQYTDHFILDENTTLPEGLGEYSNDYSNDYKI